MKFQLHILLCGISAFLGIQTLSGEELSIRRLPDGYLQIRNETGANMLLIQPDAESKVPKPLQTQPVFVLGTDFNSVLVQAVETKGSKTIRPKVDAEIPSGAVLVESVLIGKKKAGIRLKSKRANIIIASIDILSDQSFLTTQRDENIDLLIMTFREGAKLDTARINLWVSLIKTRQIALNPLGPFSEAEMVKFYRSLPTKRVLPTAILPMVEIPNNRLQFGDRQVFLLKALN
jgi:hypothetical protein